MLMAMRGWKSRSLLVLSALLWQAPASASPNDSRVGVRIGGGEGLDYYSLFMLWPSDWLQSRVVDRWLDGDLIRAYWDLSVERWEGTGADGRDNATEVYIFGPVARINWPSQRFHLLLGVQPSYMSHAHIDDDDMGGNVQFTSHAGLVFEVTPRLAVGFRGQHTSNSRLYRPNPGMNLASVTLAYRF
ncbi:acyloxyacyl hydrolase [Alloalcanivorax gelatiniphagus]|uniref:Acyloxyacyl hydrolase n=1 Tax=Alloalcanivorax gelatiniphagus TaxID=1194167 RepID=A0ABY2XKX0_9GAMM|nr:acyloxyacyl hydrolase [Alloalcanivorax gelatiniphagus]TMW12797.1 acyloxyacyl hydrolase [Alloalcanivorax gelatiniphagus]